MKKLKLTYLSPTTETLVVRFEGVVCASQDATGGASFSTPNANVEDHSDDDDWGW